MGGPPKAVADYAGVPSITTKVSLVKRHTRASVNGPALTSILKGILVSCYREKLKTFCIMDITAYLSSLLKRPKEPWSSGQSGRL